MQGEGCKTQTSTLGCSLKGGKQMYTTVSHNAITKMYMACYLSLFLALPWFFSAGTLYFFIY